MFRRATEKTSELAHYTDALATALNKGSGSIGGARSALLGHADEIDRGELSVSDIWLVLIKPARVPAEKAASLQAQAKAEQASINRSLVALGDADDASTYSFRCRCSASSLPAH
jgi:hypothetical protein